MSRKDGGPAFPRPFSLDTWGDGPKEVPPQEGMSLRDYFAATLVIDPEEPGKGRAMVLMKSAPPVATTEKPDASMEQMLWWMEAEARYRYAKADAMLKARGKA